METTYLYRHYDCHQNLLYVGITNNAIGRLQQHKRSKWFDHVENITIERHPSRKKALEAERLAIQKEHPRHNVVYNKPTNDLSNRKEFAGLLNRKQLANRWGISIPTIKRMEKRGDLKPVSTSNRVVRYSLSNVQQIESP